MRFFLVFALVLHGGLHGLGFTRTPSPFGALWIAAGGAFAVAALMLGLGRHGWWGPALIGLALSQLLIIQSWSAAKAGTLVNLVVAIPVLIAMAEARFHANTDRSARGLFEQAARAPAAPVTDADLRSLPAPVKRWLDGAGVVGRPRARVVRLRQRGLLRTAADQPWMAAQARQYFSVDPPGFVWAVEVAMKGLPVVGRDSYLGGHGRMLIKAGALWPFVDGTGAAIDEGTLLRFLGEIVWFPSAALAPYIRWEAVDDAAARATMSHAGVTASAVFTFDDRGRMIRMDAERYLGAGASAETYPPPSRLVAPAPADVPAA